MEVYPRLASDELTVAVAVAGVDTRESTVLLLTAADVVGRLVAEEAGFATSDEAGLAVVEEAGFTVVEEAGRDTLDEVFVRVALGVTVEELLVEAGRAAAGVELFREAGVTEEEVAGRDTDDGAEVLDEALDDVDAGLLTVLEEVGLGVVCAFW